MASDRCKLAFPAPLVKFFLSIYKRLSGQGPHIFLLRRTLKIVYHLEAIYTVTLIRWQPVNDAGSFIRLQQSVTILAPIGLTLVSGSGVANDFRTVETRHFRKILFFYLTILLNCILVKSSHPNSHYA